MIGCHDSGILVGLCWLAMQIVSSRYMGQDVEASYYFLSLFIAWMSDFLPQWHADPVVDGFSAPYQCPDLDFRLLNTSFTFSRWGFRN